MTMPKELENHMNEAADKYRDDDFKRNSNGYTVAPYCNEDTTSLAFKEGATWMYQTMLSRANEEFVEKLAAVESKKDEVQMDTYTDSSFTARNSFLKGARWQHAQDFIKIHLLYEELNEAVNKMAHYRFALEKIAKDFTNDHFDVNTIIAKNNLDNK